MTETYVRQFESLARTDETAGRGWFAALRRTAMGRFTEAGFPTTRDEDWRFTSVVPITQGTFAAAPLTPVAVSAIEPFLFGHPEWTRLVFVDGRFSAGLSLLTSLPEGVTVGNLPEALTRQGALLEPHLARYAQKSGSGFTALNTALMQDGAFVHVRSGAETPMPVHLVYVASAGAEGSVSHPRTLVLVEPNARASVIESYVALAPGARYFTNAVTEVVVGNGAWLEHTRLQRESECAYHVGLTNVEQGRDSHYRSFTLAMGGLIARHDLHAWLNASNIETLLYGLYLTRATQLADNHTAIHHEHPNCRSWEVYKGVLDEHSRAVFNGKVFVTPEAQKTDAKQTNRNLLLSDGARVDTKPQLEIFADDVRCTHGATVGRLDDVALFYLQSRGIARDTARRLLIYAFAAEVVAEVALAPVREELDRLVLDRVGYAG